MNCGAPTSATQHLGYLRTAAEEIYHSSQLKNGYLHLNDSDVSYYSTPYSY